MIMKNNLGIFVGGILFYEVGMPLLTKATEANGVEPTREIGFRTTEEIYE